MIHVKCALAVSSLTLVCARLFYTWILSSVDEARIHEFASLKPVIRLSQVFELHVFTPFRLNARPVLLIFRNYKSTVESLQTLFSLNEDAEEEQR